MSNDTQEAKPQKSNICEICGGIKDLGEAIRAASSGDAQPTEHPMREFKLCPGHPTVKPEKKEDHEQ